VYNLLVDKFNVELHRTNPISLREFLVLQRTFLLVYTNDCDALCFFIVATFRHVS